jgi:hypothetical protein
MTYRRTRQLRKQADREVDALLDKLYEDVLSLRNTEPVLSTDNKQEDKHV